MSDLFHQIPDPKSAVAGRNNPVVGKRLRQIIAAWRPKNAIEPGICTIARFAHRLIGRSGNAYEPDDFVPRPGTPVYYTAPVKQVETATAAGEVTTAGRAKATLTSAGMLGSPLHIPFDVDLSDSANEIAAALRAAMANHAIIDITQYFDISGEDDEIILTAKEAKANDATLNLLISDGEGEGASVGVTTVATSANTTAGVAEVLATAAPAGSVLYDATNIYIALANVGVTATAGWKKIAHADL